METNETGPTTIPGALLHFFMAPFRLRTYANLLYLILAFPLGLMYFVFLTVGLTAGVGLTIVWVGLVLLAMVFAGIWAFAAFERQMAIHLLGAEIAPMLPPPSPQARTLWQQVRDVLANPVTWKGMGFLLLKFPLGLVSFVSMVATLAISSAFLLAPIISALWDEGWIDIDGVTFQVDSTLGAAASVLVGAVLLLLSLNLLNGLAVIWRWTATHLLGSERFSEARPASGAPGLPAAVAVI